MRGLHLKRIGISYGLENKLRYGLHAGYVDALELLGAIPMPYCSASTTCIEKPGSGYSLADHAKEIVSSTDGFIISGGRDVQPHLYGEAPSALLGEVDPARDRFEIAIITETLAQGKKILAICRGMQLLNVTLGGTLYQDLESNGFDNHSDATLEYAIAHQVTIDESSVLGRRIGSSLGVNTLHHQAIKDLAPALKAVAFSDDGIIEAIEGENCVGVQWHPERLFNIDKNQLAGFSWLVEP